MGPAAPHQEATLRQVEHERTSEESHLQNGNWSDANTLRDDPSSDDERTIVASINGDHDMQQDELAVRLNGGMTGSGEDAEMQDADEEDMEDMDDDMLDKISSSPSIDDGGYSLPFFPTTWPERTSSLSPTSSPTPSPISSPSTCVDSSSPFTTTPIHFPIPVAAARRPYGVPAGSMESISMSAYRPSPIPFITRSLSPLPEDKSTNHYRGEYTRIPDPGLSTVDEAESLQVSPRTNRLLKVEDRLQNIRQDSQVSLFSDLDEEEVQLMLQPVRSPLRELPQIPSHGIRSYDESETLYDDSEDDCWTTDSDADSWDEEANNDDCNDVSFSDDARFVDSGWGGECLREAEDIDFEFVYALHTFVATVEGQANATKGDTMVLLDDSNSYWWLVRVVKDSSIGKTGFPPKRSSTNLSDRLSTCGAY